MTDSTEELVPVAVYHGSVPAFEPSFKDGEFRPWNAAYGSFVPSETPVEGPFGAVLKLYEGECFVVNGERYLNYRKAFSKSLGTGEYGGKADVTIDAPAAPVRVTALDSEGNEVFMYWRHYLMEVVLIQTVSVVSNEAVTLKIGGPTSAPAAHKQACALLIRPDTVEALADSSPRCPPPNRG